MLTRSLIVKWLSGAASPEEAAMIDTWMEADPENKRLLQHVWNRWQGVEGRPAYRSQDIGASWKALERRMVQGQELPKIPAQPHALPGAVPGLTRIIAYVSAGVVIVGAVWLTVHLSKGRPPVNPTIATPTAPPSAPAITAPAPGGTTSTSAASAPAPPAPPATVPPQRAPTSPASAPKPPPRVFSFTNASLKDVTKALSDAYGVRFVVQNQALLECRITTQFDNDSLRYVLEVLSETLNIQYDYRKDQKTVYLSGTGCNQ